MSEVKIKKISERITRAFNIGAGEAFALALKIGDSEKVKSRESVLMAWRKDDAKRLADHFWWLGKTYERSGDNGRSFAFKGAAKVVYEALERDQGFDFKTFIASKRVGFSVRVEAYDFWLSDGTLTPRQKSLVSAGHEDPNYPAPKPLWVG